MVSRDKRIRPKKSAVPLMNRPASSTHPGESSTHERAIEALARQSHVPINHVAQLYARELAALAVGAHITGFLTVLTTRKVREILRQRSLEHLEPFRYGGDMICAVTFEDATPPLSQPGSVDL